MITLTFKFKIMPYFFIPSFPFLYLLHSKTLENYSDDYEELLEKKTNVTIKKAKLFRVSYLNLF